MVSLACSELEARSNIVRFQVRVIPQDLLLRHVRRQEFQHVFDSDAQSANARPSATLIRIDGNAVEMAHDVPFSPGVTHLLAGGIKPS